MVLVGGGGEVFIRYGIVMVYIIARLQVLVVWMEL
jgi:hypothetical protein